MTTTAAAAMPRRIPRPWLNRDALEEEQDAAMRIVVAASQPQQAPPPTLLQERPNPLASLLKLTKCFCPPDGEPSEKLSGRKPSRLSIDPTAPMTAPSLKCDSPSPSNSSFVIRRRPTVIYVVNNSSPTAAEQWPKSILPPFSDQPVAQIALHHVDSMDTGITSLGFDDEEEHSLAFSSCDSELMIPHVTLQRSQSNGIPRPPRAMTHVNRSRTTTAAPRPPRARPPRVARADTPSSPNNRRFQQGGSLQGSFVVRDSSIQHAHSWDTDYDDESTLESDGDESDLFPHLDRRNPPKSPRSRQEDSPERGSLRYAPDACLSKDCILSAWLAVGDDLLTRKRPPSERHLRHLTIREGSSSICLSSGSSERDAGQDTQEQVSATNINVDTSGGCIVQATTARNGGRCVVLLNQKNTTKPLLVLQPVIMSKHNQSISAKKNAGVEQHDAALHLWFGLDGWMRRQAAAK